MTIDSAAPSALDFVIEVERLYASLLATQESDSAVEPGLGGKLLYAGELDASARAFLVAGNIAGAASLAATANASVQRQAIHDGVADFLVNSLDEALRILKNEIRKHETVAVCIAAAPLAIENEMRERGVVPDLLAPGFAGNPVLASERRASCHSKQGSDPGIALLERGIHAGAVVAQIGHHRPRLSGIGF